MTKATMIKYDLEERTAKFGEAVLLFANSLKRTPVSTPLITQLVKAGTSIGANYSEADDAESRSDFKHKIGIAKKEARETKHWLRMIITIFPEKETEAKKLWQEAKELNLIFNAIINSLNRK